MKKNLRIVSAAAAALLAVAPIASVAAAKPATTVQAARHDYSSSKVSNLLAEAAKSAGFTALGGYSQVSGGQTLHFPAASTMSASDWSVQSITRKNSDGSTDTFTPSFKGTLYKGTYTVTYKATFKNLTSSGSSNGFTNPQVADNVVRDGHTYKITYSKDSAGHWNAEVETSVNVDLPAANLYFAQKKNDALADNGTAYADVKQSKASTIKELKSNIEDVLSASYVDWGNVWNTVNDANLIGQLENQNIKVTGTNDDATFDSNGQQYTITVRTSTGLRANVVFQNTDAINKADPVVAVRFSGEGNNWHRVNSNHYVPAIYVSQSDSTKAFQPSQYIRVYQDWNTPAFLQNVTYSGTVDTTKAGIYKIEVKATNAAKKSVDLTIPVIVSDSNGVERTAINNAGLYQINNGVATLATDANGFVYSGNQVRTFGSVVTAKLNGTDTQFYRVGNPTANLYVKASDLKGYQASSNSQAVTKTINHIAAVYDKDGNQTNDQKLRAYDSVQVLPTTVTIKGSKMYQLVENGKAVDKYVKASNIDGTSKTLKHNSYVYTQYGHKVYKKNGKAVKMPKRGKRGSLRKVASGSTVTVYGGALFNKQYYRIGHNQYIKVANFR